MSSQRPVLKAYAGLKELGTLFPEDFITMTLSASSIEQFYAMRGSQYGFLERLELQQSVDPKAWSGIRLEVHLRSAAANNASRLRLVFVGVKELRVGILQGILNYVLEIRPIAEMGHEHLNYKIVESEYDAMSFLCDSFTARIE